MTQKRIFEYSALIFVCMAVFFIGYAKGRSDMVRAALRSKEPNCLLVNLVTQEEITRYSGPCDQLRGYDIKGRQ